MNVEVARVPVPTARTADAFERLFLREYERVVAIARRVLQDPGEAEDTAQEVFLSFHRRHAADAPYAAAWLYEASAHAALNRLRGNRRRARREQVTAPREDEAVADPQRSIEQAEDTARMRAALARLPEKSAKVLVLRHSGLSYAEVASALGVGVGQVGTLLRRAESALRREVET